MKILNACPARRFKIPVLLGLFLTLFLGQNSARPADQKTLAGHVLPAVSKLQPIDRLPASTNLHLAIGLSLRNKEALTNLLQQIYDPTSPNYHKYLTPEQFTEQFGPTKQDYEAVIAFAKANHLTATTTHPNRMLLDVEGQVGDIEKAFGITMRVYKHPKENRNFFATDAEPSVPAELQVLDVSGLNNYSLPHPNYRLNVSPHNAVPQAGTGPQGNYIGKDFRTAYVPGTTLTGTGQTVGLFQFDGYDPNDIITYEVLAGLPNVPLQNVLLDGFSGAPTGNGGEVEVSLDIEMVVSMAPGVSQIIVYEGNPFNAIENDILNRMATDNAAKQLSSSWGVAGGPQLTTDQIFQQIAAQGQSFFHATGDSDALPPGVVDDPTLDFNPSDSPFITQVGGTTLTTDTNGAWMSETVWNWGNEFGPAFAGEGTSGGISSFYAIPSWQQGINMTNNKGSTTFRNFPDVALTGDNIFVIADSGFGFPGTGGTSCASPLWAGFTALVNQQATASGQPPVGFINPAIYAIGKGPNFNAAFHDITTGDNTSPASPNLFFAVPGYDLCAGWGTPTGTNLINILAPPESVPLFVILTNAVTGGNGNGIIDSDECNSFELVLTNAGAAGATHVQATLTSTTPGVAIVNRTAVYPDLPVGGVGTNLVPFEISTATNFACGTPIHFTLVIKSDQITARNGFTLSTGTVGSPIRFDNGTVIGIPDNDTNGVSSIILVSGIDTALQDVQVSLNIVHPFVADLTLELIGPDGTTRILSENNGFGTNYGNSCSPDSSRTTFDDAAPTSITAGIPPFVGTFRPEQPLSVFNGKSGTAVNGPWQLHVIDGAPLDVGSIDCWSLFLTPANCVDGGGTCPGVDLALGMTAAPSPVFVGSNLTYTITVTNNGPNVAHGVVMNQTLPGSFTFGSATATQGSVGFSGGIVSANLGSLDVNATATITVVVVPGSKGTFFSTANVGALENDFDPSNNTMTIGAQVDPASADLAVTLTANPNPIPLGGVLTYTALVTNNGPVTAPNVVLTSTLPPNVSFISASQGATVANGNTIICNLGNLAVGASATVTINARGIIVSGGTATASVASSVTDPLPGNNTASVTTAVTAASDLSLAMTGAPASAILGQNVVYTLTVQNQGPSAAATLIVSDTLPPNVVFITGNSSQGSVAHAGGVVTCNMTNLVAGASATVTITVSTGGISTNQVPLTITNTAVVFSSQADPNPANNNASTTTRVDIARPSIIAAGATPAGTNGFIDPGKTVSLNLQLQNIGNLNTSNLVATLLGGGGVVTNSPQSHVYGSLIAGGAPVPGLFTFTAAGTNGGLVVATLQLQDGTNDLGTVQFTFSLPAVTVFANTTDIVIPDHGEATPYPSTINVSGVSGLIDTVTVTFTNFTHSFPDDVDILLAGPAGQTVLLTSHAGDSPVTNASLTFDDSAASFLPQTGQIVSGTYKPKQYGTVNFPASNTPAPPYGTTLSTFSGTNANGLWSLYVFDSSPGDQGKIAGGWSMAITAGTPVSQPDDIAITGTATPSPVRAGDSLTYTFNITNNGPNTASSVAFTNVLPTNVSFVSAISTQGNCATTGNGTVYCLLGSLGVGTNVTISVTVNTLVPGIITNQAMVATTDSDLDQANNVATIITVANPPVSDLSVGLTSAPSTATVGGHLVYTIAVTNNGPNTALDVVVTNVPGPVNFISGLSSTPGVPFTQNGMVICNFGNLSAGAVGTLTLVAVPTQTGPITNTASAGSLSTDPNPANNSATVVNTAVKPAPNIVTAGAKLLAESFLPNNGTIDPGETVTVSLALANQGTATTSNLVATLLATGGVITNGPQIQSYGSLTPGGPSASGAFTFTAMGTNGGGIVVTLQLQDGTTNLGTVAFNFSFPATTTFANTTPILIPDSGPGTPYPSTINIFGVTGIVSDVTVTVSNLSHAFPNDVEMLLTGPAGQSSVLMAGTGGPNAITNVTLTFDDTASSFLPSSSQIVSGTFKPTENITASLPPPAPAGPHGTLLSTFDGSNPNGTWSLYVFDNSPGDSGNIANGWSLNLTTINPLNNPFVVVLSTVIYTNGSFSMTLTGQGSQAYVIEASTDLINWTPVVTNTTSSGGTFRFTDSNAISFPYRYYRATAVGP